MATRFASPKKFVTSGARLSDAERATLGEIGHRLRSKALGEVATAALPTPSWGGTEGSSPANSTGRVDVEPGQTANQ